MLDIYYKSVYYKTLWRQEFFVTLLNLYTESQQEFSLLDILTTKNMWY